MSEIKLLPCPCCDGEALLCDPLKEEAFIYIPQVVCSNCGLEVTSHTVERVVEKWNTRKPMQEQSKKFTNEFMFEEKLQEIVYCLEKKINPLHNVNWNSAIDEAIEIVKEVGGVNAN